MLGVHDSGFLASKTEEIRKQRNALAEAVGKNKPSDEQIAQGKELKGELATIEDELRTAEEAFVAALKTIPNMPLDYVPVGSNTWIKSMYNYFELVDGPSPHDGVVRVDHVNCVDGHLFTSCIGCYAKRQR